MVQINFALREVNCKIVYYGPGRSGKTTNLEIVHQKAPQDSRGEMVSIATETDRTLFFDFLPLDLGTVAGMKTKFQLYTVPGQVYYDATRKLVLQGADGVIFVADSQKSMRDENIESLENLAVNLKENGLDISEVPLVLQWNKRDLEDIDTPDYLNEYLNRYNCPTFEAIAVKGDGVFPTLKSLASQIIKKINMEQSYAASDGTQAPSDATAKSKPQTPEAKPAEQPSAAEAKPKVPAEAPVPAAEEKAAPAAAAPQSGEVKTPAAAENSPAGASFLSKDAVDKKPEPAPQPKPAAAKEAAPVKTPEVKAPEAAPVQEPVAKPQPQAQEKKSPPKDIKKEAPEKLKVAKPVAPKPAPAPAPKSQPKVEETTEKVVTAEKKPAAKPKVGEPKNLVSAELEKRKAEREAKDKQARERIKRSARKSSAPKDWNKVIILVVLMVVILGAIGAALFFTGNLNF